MIRAGHPHGVETAHPVVTDQDVLERAVKGVPKVEGRGNVRRRNDDAIGLSRPGGVGVERIGVIPHAEHVRLGLGRSI